MRLSWVTALAVSGLVVGVPALAATPLVITATLEDASHTGRPLVRGSTNLPEGTALLVSLTGKSNAYQGDAKAVVHAGHFASPAFANAGGAVPAGVFDVTVSAAPVRAQPDAVRALLGADYSNFSSPFLRRDTSGMVLEYFFQARLAAATATPASLAASAAATKAAASAPTTAPVARAAPSSPAAASAPAKGLARAPARPPVAEAPAAPAAPATVSQAYDVDESNHCDTVQTASGHLICNDLELGAQELALKRRFLDVRLHVEKARLAEVPALLKERADALRERDATCKDKPCLLAWYVRRSDALDRWAQK